MSQTTVQSVDRAFRIMEELSLGECGFGVTELSKRLDLHKSTVHRLLITLLNLGYVERDPASDKYRLGMKLLHLSGLILDRMDLRREARGLLIKLADDVGETIHLVIPDGEEALYIDKIDGKGTLRMVSQIGRRTPMHSSAVGKAILAHSPSHKVSKILNKNLKKFTPNTIISKDLLFVHLIEVKNLGYAIDDEENEIGVRCIAAPIFNYSGNVVGSISMSGSALTILPEKFHELAKKVVNCAEGISRRMGYSKDADSSLR